jgi:hypothetical protein
MAPGQNKVTRKSFVVEVETDDDNDDGADKILENTTRAQVKKKTKIATKASLVQSESSDASKSTLLEELGLEEYEAEDESLGAQSKGRKRKLARRIRVTGDRGRLDIHQMLREYPVGATFSGFKILRSELVEELDLAAVLLRHEDTGCKYLHLARNDTDNVFATMFRTIPEVRISFVPSNQLPWWKK